MAKDIADSHLDVTDPAAWRAHLAHPQTDGIIYEFVQELRKRTESMAHWMLTKEKARHEIASIPSDIIQVLFTRFEPFIAALPAGHGRGHFTRDLIHLMTIFQDPQIQNYDPLELLVGMIAGDFHDIGNSVTKRYDDSINFASHADVGSYIFGKLAEDIIPEHILSLIQLCITSHTHYLKDIEIVKTMNGVTERRTRVPYDDAVDSSGNKFALWLTQMADRLDAQGVVFIARNVLVKVEPVKDYLEGKFYELSEREEDDFRHQFAPILRSKVYRDELPTAFEQTANILEHVHRFCESPLTQTVHSQEDSYFYRNSLMTPPALEAFQCILKILEASPMVDKEKRQASLEEFIELCKVIDPAPDIDHAISLLRKKFPLLTEQEQSQWSNGFHAAVHDLYPRYYERMKRLLSQVPVMKDQELQRIVVQAHVLAQEKLLLFQPPQQLDK